MKKIILKAQERIGKIQNLWADMEEIEARVMGSFVAGEPASGPRGEPKDYPGSPAGIEDLTVEFYLGKGWVDITALLDQDALSRYEDFALNQVEKDNQNEYNYGGDDPED